MLFYKFFVTKKIILRSKRRNIFLLFFEINFLRVLSMFLNFLCSYVWLTYKLKNQSTNNFLSLEKC